MLKQRDVLPPHCNHALKRHQGLLNFAELPAQIIGHFNPPDGRTHSVVLDSAGQRQHTVRTLVGLPGNVALQSVP